MAVLGLQSTDLVGMTAGTNKTILFKEIICDPFNLPFSGWQKYSQALQNEVSFNQKVIWEAASLQ